MDFPVADEMRVACGVGVMERYSYSLQAIFDIFCFTKTDINNLNDLTPRFPHALQQLSNSHLSFPHSLTHDYRDYREQQQNRTGTF